MHVLVIDTAGSACTVGLRVPGRDDLIRSEQMARGQAERLAPMTQDCLAEAGVVPHVIDRIGVITGPGSFAGTRVGVAFARGLALATGATCVGVSSLEWWAGSVDPVRATTITAIHDARRGELVIQDFANGQPVSEARTRSIEAVRAQLTERLGANGSPSHEVNLVGSGAGLVFPGGDLLPVLDEPDPARLLDMVESMTAPFEQPRPFYARPPDAKLPGGLAR